MYVSIVHEVMEADQELLQCEGRIDTSTLPKASANRIAQNYGR